MNAGQRGIQHQFLALRLRDELIVQERLSVIERVRVTLAVREMELERLLLRVGMADSEAETLGIGASGRLHVSTTSPGLCDVPRLGIQSWCNCESRAGPSRLVTVDAVRPGAHEVPPPPLLPPTQPPPPP